MLVRRECVENQVEIIDEKNRPPADRPCFAQEGFGRALRITPGRLKQAAIQPSRDVASPGRIAPLRERLTAVSPKAIKRTYVVLLLAERQRNIPRRQIGILLDPDRQPAQQAGLAHAALSDDKLVFGRGP